MPPPLSFLITPNKVLTSVSSSDEVGSSMMTSLARMLTARAMAVICWVAVLHDRSGRLTSTDMPKPARMRALSTSTWRQSIRPKRAGSRPRKMFSATERCGTRLSSWYIVLNPARCAAMGTLKSTPLPSNTMVPASRALAPVRILISVDLPAPFCPIRACTSPRPTHSRLWRRAGTPPKALSMPRISSSGVRGAFMLMSAAGNDRSVAVGHVGLSVALVVELVFHLDPARNFFALGVLPCGLTSDGAEERAGLDGGAHLAGRDRSQRVPGAVDRHHHHILTRLLAGRFERRNRTDGHLVVVRVDGGDVRMGLEQGLHHLAALVPGKITGLGSDNLQPRVFGDHVVEALLAVVGRR